MEHVRSDYSNNELQQIAGLIVDNRNENTLEENQLRLRYLQNPFGKAIILCGKEDGAVAVCVVIEQVRLFCFGKVRHCGLASVFSSKKGCITQDEVDGLLRLAEIEARNEGLEIIYAFEELAEREKAKGLEWNWRRSDIKYRALQIEPFRSLFRITDMAKPFVPETIVYSDYNKGGLPQQTDSAEVNFNVVSPVMSEAFLNWYCRICNGREIAEVDNDKVGVLGYVGKRSGIKEFHLLNLFHGADGELLPHIFEGVVKTISTNLKPDIITFEEGEHLLPEVNTEYVMNHIEYGYKVMSGSGEYVEEIAIALYRWFGIW